MEFPKLDMAIYFVAMVGLIASMFWAWSSEGWWQVLPWACLFLSGFFMYASIKPVGLYVGWALADWRNRRDRR